MFTRQAAICLLLLLNAITGAVHAQPPAVSVKVERCAVYTEQDQDRTFDCTDIARQACPEESVCELPIGMNLTRGQDLDANEKTWELVKVEYSCGAKFKFNGPHYQNNHATMTLSCPH